MKASWLELENTVLTYTHLCYFWHNVMMLCLGCVWIKSSGRLIPFTANERGFFFRWLRLTAQEQWTAYKESNSNSAADTWAVSLLSALSCWPQLALPTPSLGLWSSLKPRRRDRLSSKTQCIWQTLLKNQGYQYTLLLGTMEHWWHSLRARQ